MERLYFRTSSSPTMQGWFTKMMDRDSAIRDPRLLLIFGAALAMLAVFTMYAHGKKKSMEIISPTPRNPKILDLKLVESSCTGYLRGKKIELYTKAFDVFKDNNELSTHRLKNPDSYTSCLNQPFAPIEINATFKSGYYQIATTTDLNIQEFWVDFAANRLGGGCFDTGFVQEERLVAECPNLAAHIAATKYNGKEEVIREGTIPRPLIMKNIRRVLDIPQDIYGQKGLKDGDLKQVKINKNPPSFDMLAMALERLSSRDINIQASPARVKDTINTLLAGFLLAQQETPEGKQCVINSGKLGCGAFNNDSRMVALAHIVVAQRLGVNVVLYDYSQSEMEEILDLYKNMRAASSLQDYAESISSACLKLKPLEKGTKGPTGFSREIKFKEDKVIS